MSELPSTRRDCLANQLRDAVAQNEPTEGFIRAILADAWRRVHLGDPAAPREWREAIARMGSSCGVRPEVKELVDQLSLASVAIGDGRISGEGQRLMIEFSVITTLLWERRGEPQTLADLSERINANGLAGRLEQLVDAGLVMPVRDKDDTRRYALSGLGVRTWKKIQDAT